MAKNDSTSGTSGEAGRNSDGVSDARLHQKSGYANAMGGYVKVARPDGTFRMRKTDR